MQKEPQANKTFTTDRHTPKQLRAKERVRQIVAAAAAEFQEHGVENVSTNHIAARAQLPVGSLYKYFKDKDSIIIALLELYKQDMLALISEVANTPFIPDATLKKRLRLMLSEFAHYSVANQSMGIISFAQSEPRFHEKLGEMQAAIRGAIASLLAGCEVSDPEAKAINVTQYIRNYTDLALQAEPLKLRAQENIIRALDQLLRDEN